MRFAKPFFVTRQRLAERLAMAGIELVQCQNIYDPDQKAWKCALTKDSAKVISEFYNEIGKTLPAVVVEALNA